MPSNTEFLLEIEQTEIEQTEIEQTEKYLSIKKIGDYMLVAGVCTLGVMSIASCIAMLAIVIKAEDKDKNNRHSPDNFQCRSSGDSDFYRFLSFWLIFNNNGHEDRHHYRDKSTDILGLFLLSFIATTIAVSLSFVYCFYLVAGALILGWGAGAAFTIVGAMLADYANDKFEEISTRCSNREVFAEGISVDEVERMPANSPTSCANPQIFAQGILVNDVQQVVDGVKKEFVAADSLERSYIRPPVVPFSARFR